MKHLIIFPFIFTSFLVHAQTDSTKQHSKRFNGMIGLMGRHQSGNLDQFSIMPHARFSWSDSSLFSNSNLSYQFLKVQGFNPINDFWINSFIQHRPYRRFYPVVQLISGFAKSFRIDQSTNISGGAGFNMLPKRSAKYLQVHAMVGYLNFQFEELPLHQATSVNSFIRAGISIAERIGLLWEMNSYHSTNTRSFWGGSNMTMLDLKFFKLFGINLSHQLFYNNQGVSGTEKLNSTLQTGINLKL